MAGFENNVLVAKNLNFDESGPKPHLGIINAAGKIPIGTGNSQPLQEILAGSITSPLGTLTIGYSSPNITIDVAGGSAPIEQFTVDGAQIVVPSGSPLNVNLQGSIVSNATNSKALFVAKTASNTAQFQIQVGAAIAATDVTKVGLAAFNSAQFSVDSNGFVSIVGGGFTWNDVSGAFSPLKENGYFVTGTATGTLPASPAQGDTIKFFVDHASQLLTIKAAGTQIIRLGTLVSSAGGTMVSTQQGDSVELTYRASDTCWCAIAGFTGIWTNT